MRTPGFLAFPRTCFNFDHYSWDFPILASTCVFVRSRSTFFGPLSITRVALHHSRGTLSRGFTLFTRLQNKTRPQGRTKVLCGEWGSVEQADFARKNRLENSMANQEPGSRP